ncbi:uncharacterized protein LOC118736450 [Rhagoletis pomonella]|uniref:uncharacterized protein LOC118736450 n=1 Tax=Rhagoletis pomonella TaxID=28610 RepID=UPI00177ABB80|nr:uncharacterized protein LOC118736450 [Rhagoletis pomonella]
METKIIKKKIKREKPNKKWTLEEVNTILNYLMDSQEIEKPTAQIFYKKLIEKTGINATWELIRWKVRHLKSTYKDASDWRSSTGAGLLEIDAGANSVEGKIFLTDSYLCTLKKSTFQGKYYKFAHTIISFIKFLAQNVRRMRMKLSIQVK